jgi:hypothetical protein
LGNFIWFCRSKRAKLNLRFREAAAQYASA